MSGFTLSGRGLERVQAVAPATGNTVVVSAGTTALLLSPAGTLATLTITLPSSPVNGQALVIATSQALTALTVNGGTIVGTLTTLALGGFAYFVYDSATSKWFRCG